MLVGLIHDDNRGTKFKQFVEVVAQIGKLLTTSQSSPYRTSGLRNKLSGENSDVF